MRLILKGLVRLNYEYLQGDSLAKEMAHQLSMTYTIFSLYSLSDSYTRKA
jgi:hypothetical protein